MQRGPDPGGVRRDLALDALRGLVMVLMALDHTREFFHRDAIAGMRIDALHSDAWLFMTRWITHLCAPTFAVLTGVGAHYWSLRHGGSLGRHLWVRGLWLVLLELVAVRFAYFWGWMQGPVILAVLWSLGLSMLLLAALHRAPRPLLAWGGAAVLAGYGLLDASAATSPAALALWHVLFQPGVIPVAGVPVIVGYPLVPWASLVLLGYGLAPRLAAGGGARVRALALSGAALLALFLVLRALNHYGDAVPWQRGSGVHGLLSFVDCSKYPPSPDFVLMTLGVAALILALFSGREGGAIRTLAVYGRAPLLYYVAHLLVIHLLAFPMAWARYGSVGFLFAPLPSLGGSPDNYPPNFGYSLWTVYGVWVFVVLMLYPLCRRYGTWAHGQRAS